MSGAPDRTLPPLRRSGALLAAWGLYFAASPGVVTRDGVPLATLVAVALWGAAASRPGRFAFWIEALAGGLGWVGLMGWAGYVWAPLLGWIGPGHGLYVAVTGLVLRRLARVLPLAAAVPLAWVGLETLRGVIEPPFGLQSLQLGHHLHVWHALAGSARVWGVGGLGIALGALAGLAADALLARGRPARRSLVWGLAPLGLALGLGALFPAPAVVPGPTVLLVQPAFEQVRKQFGDPVENHRDAETLTLEAVASGPVPDLVCWGETMVASSIFDDAVLAALEGGWEPPEWQRRWLTADRIRAARRAEEVLLTRGLLPRLPAGTAFVAGIEVYRWDGEAARRGNGVVLWDAGGRSEAALKLHTVPGAESMLGLERFAFVRDTVFEIAGYVPNLEAGEETGILELAARDGRTYRIGASVCFDNAFLDPYTAPLRRGPLDFHLVVSNEAWYRESWEADQMMAYSRIAALATGRALVRATNSGISAVFRPDGSAERLGGEETDGKMQRGTLTAAVPVPPAGEGAVTPFVRLEALWTVAWLLAPLAGLVAARRREARSEP